MSSQFSETVRSFLAPIVSYLDDPEVSEIMINSPDEIWIERKGKVERTEAKFDSSDALMSAVNNISQFVKRRINEETPTMDARLPDGSRIHAILPPCARKGICLDIRKFSKDALTVKKLIEFGSLTEKALEFLKACTYTKKNIIVSVPNCQTPISLRQSGLTFHHWVDRSHEQTFTLKELVDLLEQNGFQLTVTRFINPIKPEFLVMRVWHIPFRIARIISQLLNKVPIKKQYFMTLLAVGEKN